MSAPTFPSGRDDGGGGDEAHGRNVPFKLAIAYPGGAAKLRVLLQTLDLVANLPIVSRKFVRSDPDSPYRALLGGAVFGDVRWRSLKKKWRLERTDLHPQHPTVLQVDVVGPKAATLRALNAHLAMAFHKERADSDGQWSVQAYEVGAFLDACLTTGKPMPRTRIVTRITPDDRAAQSLEAMPARLFTLVDPARHHNLTVTEDGSLGVAGELFPSQQDVLAFARAAELRTILAGDGDGDDGDDDGVRTRGRLAMAHEFAAALDAEAVPSTFQETYLPAILDRLRRRAALALEAAEPASPAQAAAATPLVAAA